MNHRDYILIKKIISELDVADELLGVADFMSCHRTALMSCR